MKRFGATPITQRMVAELINHIDVYHAEKQDGVTTQHITINNKPSFTNDDSLLRMLYLASQRIVKHWHARYQNWDLVLSQLEILFTGQTCG